MNNDRRTVIRMLGGWAAVAGLSASQKADALEELMFASIGNAPTASSASNAPSNAGTGPRRVRRGTGRLFGDGHDLEEPLPAMPKQPTLVDFFQLRFGSQVRHCLQSATHSQRNGDPEEVVMACLLHDLAQCLMCVDHGWWGAQLMEPYVPEKVSWAIRYHQALRFFADESVGYTYPEHYIKVFGPDYRPEPYIREAYEYARNHKWYMAARLITVHDVYSFDPSVDISIDPFVDLIGRHFRQPKEGLGFDGSPVAHMWRSLIYPDNPL